MRKSPEEVSYQIIQSQVVKLNYYTFNKEEGPVLLFNFRSNNLKAWGDHTMTTDGISIRMNTLKRLISILPQLAEDAKRLSKGKVDLLADEQPPAGGEEGL